MELKLSISAGDYGMGTDFLLLLYLIPMVNVNI